MIQSIFDSDLYKFTTSYAYLKLYPNAEGTFTFNDRDKTQYDDKFVEDLQMEFVNLSHLSLRKEEMDWLMKMACVEIIQYGTIEMSLPKPRF